MGRYSRKDMLEFAKFAKSYQSSRNVEEAYAEYLKGVRHVGNKEPSLYQKILRSNVIYFNNLIVKNRYGKEQVVASIADMLDAEIESWNKRNKILMLKTK